MKLTRLPKTLTNFKYVLIEHDFGIFRIILPSGSSYTFEDIESIYDYLMREFDDEEFIEHVLAGVTNFRKVQLLPKQKHYIHVPEMKD